MAIRKFKPHETITTEQLNKLVDAYNSIEFTKEELEQLLIKAQKQNEDNQSVINAFVSSFADIVKEQPSVLNTLELFSVLRNSGPLASYGYRSETIPFSVFYGNDAEINSRAKVNGQWLINTNAGTIQLDIQNSQDVVERITINGQVSPISQTIGIDPLTKTWTINGNDTGVIAEGIGIQGYQGLQGKPGKTIRLETVGDDPSGEIGYPVGQSELEQNVFMSAAKIWNNKIYAPYISISESGVVGKYQEVADLNIQYQILDQNGKSFYDDDASTDVNDYTYYINGNNTGVRAIGPKGDKGDTGDTWYVHTYYSAIDLNDENSDIFFDSLQHYKNEAANFLVVVSGSSKAGPQNNEGVPLFSKRPNRYQLKTFYDNGNYEPAHFAIYTIAIKPAVLVPKLVSTNEGFTLSWIFKTDVTVNELPTVDIKHGRNVEPVGKYPTMSAAITEAQTSGRTYATYILNIKSDKTEDLTRDYLWVYNEEIANDTMFYLGRLTGERGVQGDKGETGEKGIQGDVGPTGPRGGMPFNLVSPYVLNNNEEGASVIATFCQSPTNDAIQAGDFIIDKNGKMAIVTSITQDTNRRANYYVFADLMGPKGDNGDKGDKGDTGAKGDKGDTGLRGGTIFNLISAYALEDVEGGSQIISTLCQSYSQMVIQAGDFIVDKNGKLAVVTSITQGEHRYANYYVFSNIKGPKGETGEKGNKGDKGDMPNIVFTVDGHQFKYSINGGEFLYLYNLSVLKGEAGAKGDKGDVGKDGPAGPQGEAGPPGKSISITGFVSSPDSLTGYVGSANDKDAYIINNEGDPKDGHLYVFDANGSPPKFNDVGKIQGPKGTTGNPGDDGRSITGITTKFIASSQIEQPVTAYYSLSTALGSWNETNKYLWKETKISFSSGTEHEYYYEIAAVYGAKGNPGNTPYIQSGNWWINGVDTGVKAAGTDGQTPSINPITGKWKFGNVDTEYNAIGIDGHTPEIDLISGNWKINGQNTGHKAIAVDGVTPHIGENGNWWLAEVDTGVKAAGVDGETPIMNPLSGKWQINGEDTEYDYLGKDGITPEIDEESGCWIIDGNLTEFQAVAVDGVSPHIGQNGNWWIGTNDTGTKAAGTNGTNGTNGTDGTNGTNGDSVSSIATTFVASTSTTQPSSGWGAFATEFNKLNSTTKYLWKKTVYTLSPSNQTKTTYEIATVHGQAGPTGATFSYNNTSGNGILTITTTV